MELDNELRGFIQAGCALLAGTVSTSGRPVASRGWSCQVSPDGTTARLIIPAMDFASFRVSAAVAVTGADVPSLRSVQIKGVITAVEATVDHIDDVASVAAYCDDYYGDITETDGFPREICELMTPSSFSAITFTVEEVFDQTPGPTAGSPLRVEA